jgi:hypothetical protein
MIDTMLPHVDTWTQIFDCTNMGYANFDRGAFNAVEPMMRAHSCNRRHVVYVLGGGMILTGIWAILKAFLPEKSTSKAKFIATAAELLPDIDAD